MARLIAFDRSIAMFVLGAFGMALVLVAAGELRDPAADCAPRGPAPVLLEEPAS